ncbi:HutD family protein [Flavobacterium sp. JP2137]|uniref:HutD family protein n=1 Tax=Flavobacterium sp. JP2137 TaxID=3414510 RepID=UPI003D2FBC73
MKITYKSLNQIEPHLWAGGSTFQYFLYPNQASYAHKDFTFRISSATLEQSPSVFTQFDGYTRYLCMLDNPLDLSRNGINQHFKKREIFLFDSADTVISTSLGTDFNWMVSHKVNKHHLEITDQSQSSASPFIILFALEPVDIKIDQGSYQLEKSSCLLIENSDEVRLTISFDSPLVFMTLTV